MKEYHQQEESRYKQFYFEKTNIIEGIQAQDSMFGGFDGFGQHSSSADNDMSIPGNPCMLDFLQLKLEQERSKYTRYLKQQLTEVNGRLQFETVSAVECFSK